MIIDVAPGIKFVRAQRAGFPFCHTIFIDSEIKAVIDTGAGDQALASINPDSIDLVINTHYHRDHVAGNHLFPNSRVLVHRLEYPPLVDEAARRYYAGLDRLDQINEGVVKSSRAPSDKHIPPRVFKIDGFLSEGEIIDFGHTRARVLHLPGHTPGHIGFHFENEDIVCGADIDLIPSGPWYGDHLSNLDDFESSILRLMDINPRIYCSAHRKPIKDEVKLKLGQYLAKIEESEEKIREQLGCPRTLDELVGLNIFYKNYDYPYNAFWERNMIEKHLDRMFLRGGVIKNDNQFELA